MNCVICERSLDKGTARCPGCGAPGDVGERKEPGQAGRCSECEATIWSLIERCPSCGAVGYPALRPRLGDKSQIGPENGK